MTAFLFPGQGSQFKGMGRDLFDAVPQFKSVEPQVNAVLGYSVRELCLEDRNGQLKDTRYTQPALYVANALHYFQAINDGQRPKVLAGHSLGEFNALMAAGAYDFITGLRLVKKRGELMSEARNGAMAAVIGLDADGIAAVIRDNALAEIDVANYNAPLQTVISGPVEQIRSAASLMEAAGAKLYVQLAVSAAFHSRYMVTAAQTFERFLSAFTFFPLQLPVVANCTGSFYPADAQAPAIRSMLVRQISSPVLWQHSVRCLLDSGTTELREIGPGTVLTKLVQQIRG